MRTGVTPLWLRSAPTPRQNYSAISGGQANFACGVSLQQLIGSAKIGSNLFAVWQLRSSKMLGFSPPVCGKKFWSEA
ncbi:MAG: hypothetical protein AAB674_00320 [Patescibacteria group bacterium]